MPEALFINMSVDTFEPLSTHSTFVSHQGISYVNVQSDSFEVSTYDCANIDILDQSISDNESITSGSIIGVVEHNIMFEHGDDTTSIMSGSILGTLEHNVMFEHMTDSNSKSAISIEEPSTLEGLNLAEINYTPSQIIEEEAVEVRVVEKTRDISRFRKAYSFTRNKPVRFRVTRRV